VVVEVVVAAVGMFAVTNVDDLVVLSLFFGRADGVPGGARRVVVGQYLGFGAILIVSVVGGWGATLLPAAAVAYLGLVPIAIGLHAGYRAWRDRGDDELEAEAAEVAAVDRGGPGAASVAAVTFANGGDNIGVYMPVFAVAGAASMSVYVPTFLVMVGVWCGVGWFVATRPVVARALARWGHVLLPVVLIAIGVVILVQGGAVGR